MELKKLYTLIEDFYGYKCNMRGINSKTNEVYCILYDSFLLKCSLDDCYGRFGAGLFIGEDTVITEFLGRRCSLNSDEQSIKESLQIIDEYCRLRLPDKFLKAYFDVYEISKHREEHL